MAFLDQTGLAYFFNKLKNFFVKETEIASLYDYTKTYALGDYVWYNGSLYRCITPITTAEAWTAAHWAAAVLGDDVGDLKSALNEYTDAYYITDYEMKNGYAINTSNGNEVQSQFYSHSSLIPCGEICYIYARMTANLGIIYYGIDGNRVGQQSPDTNTLGRFYLNKPDGAYYLIFNNNYAVTPNSEIEIVAIPHNLNNWGNDTARAISQNAVTAMETASYTVDMTEGKYISTTTGAMNNVPYGRSASASDYIDVNQINAIYTSMHSVYGLAYYDANKTFITGLNPFETVSPQWYFLDPPFGAKYLRFTCYGNDDSIVQCRMFYGYGGYKGAEKLKAESPYVDIIGMYDNTIHIGDSLTYSQVWLSNVSQRQAFATYPEVFGKLCGVNASALAFSGATAKTWWAEYNDNLTTHGLHIVFLGTNGGLTDTISTDCPSSDVSDFADTNTGCYGAILQTITDNGDKAVLVKVFRNLTNSATTNSVIEQFGERYNFPVIDIDAAERFDQNLHYNPTDPSYSNYLHFNDLGYAWEANIIKNKINALSLADKYKIIRTRE